jgi:hypothetical protein
MTNWKVPGAAATGAFQNSMAVMPASHPFL